MEEKKKRRHRPPSIKQVKALQLINQGYSPHKAMIEAGYSKHVATHPTENLFKRKGFQNLLSSMGTELTNLGLVSKFWAQKIKDWSESDSEKIQQGAFDRWHRIMKDQEERSGVIGTVKRKVTFEEFVTGKDNDGPDV